MSPKALIHRLQHDGLSVAYVAAYLMIPNGAARKWLIDHGARESRSTLPHMWRIPSSDRLLTANRRWNTPAEVRR